MAQAKCLSHTLRRSDPDTWLGAGMTLNVTQSNQRTGLIVNSKS